MALSAGPQILALLRMSTPTDAVLGGLLDDVILMLVEVMRPRVGDAFGDYGLMLATAHEATLLARAGVSAAGPLTQEREGQLARAYAAPENFDPYFSTTAYGVRFIGLRRAIVVTPVNRRALDPCLEARYGQPAPAIQSAPSAPQPPTNLVASAIGGGQITLNWTASQGASSYLINRSTIAGAEQQIATSVFAAMFTDSGLNPSSRYYYTVQAVGPGGNSNPSNESSAVAT